MRAAHEVPSQSQAPGLGEPGANPLFFGVLIALTLGLVAGLTSSGTTTLLRSNLVFRVAVGGIVAGVAYVAVAAVWFAWHRRTFKGFRGPGFGADAPEQIESETTARADEIKEFMDYSIKSIDDLNARLETLE